MFRFIFFTLCLSTCALGALYENASSGGGFITLEEHYVPSVLRSYEQTNQVECLNAEVQSISLPSRLGDISNRLREMDETGIEMQVGHGSFAQGRVNVELILRADLVHQPEPLCPRQA